MKNHEHMLCTVCSQVVCCYSSAFVAYLIHMIDEHWSIMDRIHSTTGDNAARYTLAQEVANELGIILPEHN